MKARLLLSVFVGLTVLSASPLLAQRSRYPSQAQAVGYTRSTLRTMHSGCGCNQCAAPVAACDTGCSTWQHCCPPILPCLLKKIDHALQTIFCCRPCATACDSSCATPAGCGCEGNWSPLNSTDPFQDDLQPPPVPTEARHQHWQQTPTRTRLGQHLHVPTKTLKTAQSPTPVVRNVSATDQDRRAVAPSNPLR